MIDQLQLMMFIIYRISGNGEKQPSHFPLKPKTIYLYCLLYAASRPKPKDIQSRRI